MRYLLDSVAISDRTRSASDRGLADWLSKRHSEDLATSVICIAELRCGISLLPPSRRRDILEHWFADDILRRFGERILPVDREVVLRWGELHARLSLAGRPLPIFDSLIAATALVHGLAVVTRNERDFAAAGVDIINPWTG